MLNLRIALRGIGAILVSERRPQAESGLHGLSRDTKLIEGRVGIETWVHLAAKVHIPRCLSVVLKIGCIFTGLEHFHKYVDLISRKSSQIQYSLFVHTVDRWLFLRFAEDRASKVFSSFY